MKKVAVILSGCGVQDGTEIHESVLTLLALDRIGAQAVFASVDKLQADVVDHQTSQLLKNQARNALHESARIARGHVESLETLSPDSVDAVILPGGYGAAKNLSSFATKGKEMEVDSNVARFLTKAKQLGKPLGFICISPVIAAKLFGGEHIKLTIGNDPEVASVIESFGASHVNSPVQEAVVDTRHKIVSTPAYMLAKKITEAEAGIRQLVQKVLEMA